MGQLCSRFRLKRLESKDKILGLTVQERLAMTENWNTAKLEVSFFTNSSLVLAFFKWDCRHKHRLDHLRLSDADLRATRDFQYMARIFFTDFEKLITLLESKWRLADLLKHIAHRYADMGLAEEDFQNLSSSVVAALNVGDTLAAIAWGKAVYSVRLLMRRHLETRSREKVAPIRSCYDMGEFLCGCF